MGHRRFGKRDKNLRLMFGSTRLKFGNATAKFERATAKVCRHYGKTL